MDSLLNYSYANKHHLYVDSLNSFKCVIANTAQQLNEYYQLLEYSYRVNINSNFSVSWEEKLFNAMHAIIIVAINFDGQVIGGCRNVVSSSNHNCKLPLEKQLSLSAIKLDELIQKLGMSNANYSEWGRHVVDQSVENKHLVFQELARKCFEVSLKNGCVVQFGITLDYLQSYIESIVQNLGYSYNKVVSSDNLLFNPLFPDCLLYLGCSSLL